MSLLLSCRGGNGHNDNRPQGDKIELKYSANLCMDSICRGVTLVTIRNPWDTTRIMAKYALIEEDHDDYGTLAKDVMTVNVPLRRSVVYSGVHVSLIDELGAGEAIAGICDLPYINCRKVRKRVERGEVADCGQSSSPNIELIISRKSDALILSPYE
ncbi:MAG: ABC transporter substrate-binding protein, partial [Lepagella sp.]